MLESLSSPKIDIQTPNLDSGNVNNNDINSSNCISESGSLINVRSLRGYLKTSFVFDHLLTHKLSFSALTKTWMRNTHDFA